MIPVNKPFMPPIKDFEAYIKDIWKREWLTNSGPLVTELEHKLINYLDVGNLKFVTNGTIALQLAIKALELRGEIITTPFSYVATTSSIVWEGCTPVFVDIDSKSLNINPELIKKSITLNTSAILATHVFGSPCDIDAIIQIANDYQLKVIFDAAHCFGSQYKGISVYNYGDISTASFHATKVFQSVEGGAVISDDPVIAERIELMRNFGHDGPLKFNGIGINGKNSELHAAMGLCNLVYIDHILATRKKQCGLYDQRFVELKADRQQILPESKINYSYYPLIFENEEVAVEIQSELEKENIFTRRYFYPSLSQLNYVNRQQTPVSDDIASRILCLPLYFGLKESEQEKVARVILRTQKKKVF